MSTLAPLAVLGTGALTMLAALAGWLDVATRRLPNWLCLLTAATGLAFGVAQSGAASFVSPLGHGVLALLLGMGLFAAGWIGGGDAKFYASCACWFPLGSAPALLALVSLSGVVILALWFAARQTYRAAAPANDPNFGKLPYGVAIGCGAVALRALAP